jgi:hypothetical protein
VDYKKTLTLNRDMGEALAPVMDTFVPLEPAVEPPPSFLTHTRHLADEINEYLQQTVQQTVEQLLASVQAFNPGLDLQPVGEAMPDECSQEEFQALTKKLAPVAAKYMESIDATEEDSQ